MPRDLDFIATGEVFCDLVMCGIDVPEPGTETFADRFAFSAGGVFNRAVASARLGRRTAAVSAIGDDFLGRAVLEEVAGVPGLDLSWLAVRPGWQTPVSVALSGADDRRFLTYYEPAEPVPAPDGLGRVGVLDIGVDGPVPDWALRLRDAGTRLYAGAGWDATGAWSRDRLERLADVDAFVLNSVEALSYARAESLEHAARILAVFCPLVVITRGPDGAIAHDRTTGQFADVPGVTVDAADPTGAGDTFVAAFAASEGEDWPLEDRLRLANLAAALSVRGLGGAASAPDRDQLVAVIDDGSSIPDATAAGWDRIRTWLTASSAPTTQESLG